MSVTTPARNARLLRRALRHTPVLAMLLVAALAAPARADVPEGWSDPDPVDGMHALLVLVLVPLGLFVLLVVATYLPAMVKGERLLPDHGKDEATWLGGPRSGAKELPSADDEHSRAGGASGSW